ncbi:hypothetical protein Pcinc_024142 [Petrolisthes cinctipes]|uniref:Uncharacterized protein n=1 Tax=Petrolisthes cinctipes TaxID=88211 RepID=A0AAE1FAH1_PETCI|nr:hypothetical protein Pcinc_024142 [Petrolisthes cinctipes]
MDPRPLGRPSVCGEGGMGEGCKVGGKLAITSGRAGVRKALQPNETHCISHGCDKEGRGDKVGACVGDCLSPPAMAVTLTKDSYLTLALTFTPTQTVSAQISVKVMRPREKQQRSGLLLRLSRQHHQHHHTPTLILHSPPSSPTNPHLLLSPTYKNQHAHPSYLNLHTHPTPPAVYEVVMGGVPVVEGGRVVGVLQDLYSAAFAPPASTTPAGRSTRPGFLEVIDLLKHIPGSFKVRGGQGQEEEEEEEQQQDQEEGKL